jgi:non-ribosomal peptide synthetase component F
VQKQMWRDLDHALFDGIEVQRERNRLLSHIGAAGLPVVYTSTIGAGPPEVPDAAAPALVGKIVHSISQTSQVLLDHQVTEVGEALSYTWDFDEELLPEGMLNAMFAAYGNLLHELCTNEGAWNA